MMRQVCPWCGHPMTLGRYSWHCRKCGCHVAVPDSWLSVHAFPWRVVHRYQHTANV